MSFTAGTAAVTSGGEPVNFSGDVAHLARSAPIYRGVIVSWNFSGPLFCPLLRSGHCQRSAVSYRVRQAAGGGLLGGQGMQYVSVGDNRHAPELLEADRRVAEIHALVERQRQLIEKLGLAGHDITSAQIVFDSLCASLSLQLQDRHRLRAKLNVKAA